MPQPRKRLVRRELANQARYLTFSCLDRALYLSDPAHRDMLADQLFTSRGHLGFRLHAWVIMPEHVHLLLTPPLPDVDVPRILSAIKRRSATRILAVMRQHGDAPPRLWQPGGGYDRNILGGSEFNEKIRYIHENPVRRGLVSRPEDWVWSSARAWSGFDTPWPEFDRSP
ncbi:MAG: REP-associated tyrosine transposase [Phycisphaerales bacterium]